MFGHLFSSKSEKNTDYRNHHNFNKGMRARKTVWVATPFSMRSVSFTSNDFHSDRPVKLPR